MSATGCVCTKGSISAPYSSRPKKFIMESEKEDLMQKYNSLIGAGNVLHVPLCYTQYNNIKVFEQTFTSRRSRTSRSFAVK